MHQRPFDVFSQSCLAEQAQDLALLGGIRGAVERLARRAEQLRQAVRDLALSHEGQRLGQITLSLGVACYPDHASTGEALIRAADALLYQAKKEGRDRVVSAPAQPAETTVAS